MHRRMTGKGNEMRKILLRAAALALAVWPRLAAAEMPKLVVVMPTPPATYMLPYYMAQAAGLYERAGVDIEAITVNGDQNSLRAVVTGSGNIAVIGPPILYDGLGGGAKIKGIVGWQATTDYYLVLAKGKGTTLADAAGKTLAVSTPGSMPYLIPQMMFKKNHIDGSATKYVALGGLSARLQAVAAGKVDGTVTDTMNALRGEKAGQITLITNTNEQFPEGLGYIYLTVLEAQLQDPAGRKALYAFTKASIEGARMVMDQPDRAAEIFYEKMSKDVDLGLLKETVRQLNKLGIWGTNGGIEATTYEFTMRTYLDYGILKSPVSYDEAIDRSLVDEAITEIGRR